MLIESGNNYKVYVTDVAQLDDESCYAAMYEKVSERRRHKTDRLKFRKDKLLSLAAESLLIQACEDYGLDYYTETIIENEYSKPDFAGGKYHFGLSHSGTKAMCVIADCPVGCDVEIMDKANLDIAKRFFSKDEYAVLESIEKMPDKKDMFYRIWTLKESFVKCIGKGMSCPFDSFAVEFFEDEHEISNEEYRGKYKLHEIKLEDGYKYSMCMKIQ